MSTIALTDSTLVDFVAKSQVPVVVDFWAEWCGPCKMIAPALEKIAEKYEGKIVIAKIDVEQNPMASSRFGIRNIPALILFKDGVPVSNKVGAGPQSAMEHWINSFL